MGAGFCPLIRPLTENVFGSLPRPTGPPPAFYSLRSIKPFVGPIRKPFSTDPERKTMLNRLRISTALRKFFQYLQASPNMPQPLTLEVAQEQLDQVSLFRLSILLGGLGPDENADQVQQ